MTATPNTVATVSKHVPWNKGNIVGAKPPLRPRHVWSIRTKLQVKAECAIWLCSTSLSIASCAAATS